jgi:hypothetical protein
MTTVDVLFHFAMVPSERSVLALASIREVYGIRRVTLDERAGTIGIEYDATRLNEPVVRQLLRRAGIEIIDPPSVEEPLEQDDPAALPA